MRGTKEMKIIEFKQQYSEETAELLAAFRVTLKRFKGIEDKPDLPSAREELEGFVSDKDYPVYICVEDDEVLGYMILHVFGVIWVEQIYVRDDSRRKGVGSLLFAKAEECSSNINEDTLFNYVHPNNDAMINFLKSKGYDVLNLIEIRKPWKNEKNDKTIKVGNHEFKY